MSNGPDINIVGAPARPTVVVLCGSTRFSHAYREANLRETLAGRIVLTIGCDMLSDAELFTKLGLADPARVKAGLDELHLRKIDLADEVLVLNVNGYVGDSTRSEIAYAEALGKPIRWLEPHADEPDDNPSGRWVDAEADRAHFAALGEQMARGERP